MAKLQEVREAKGLNQKALADLIQMSNISVSLIEAGKTYPLAITRARITSILGPVDFTETRLQSLGFKGKQPAVADHIIKYILSSPETDRKRKIAYLRRIINEIEKSK